MCASFGQFISRLPVIGIGYPILFNPSCRDGSDFVAQIDGDCPKLPGHYGADFAYTVAEEVLMITGAFQTHGLWFAYREEYGQEVVLKPEQDYVDPRLPDELRRIRHPGLAAVYGVTVHEDVPFEAVVCEWIRGRWLRGRRSTPTEARALIEAILKIRAEITTLIGMPWAHLDLKPDHIILRPNGKPVLLDPASACLFPRTATERVLRLTPSWAAPEAIRGEPCPASDLYSLALVWLALCADDVTHPPPDRRTFAKLRRQLPPEDFAVIAQWLENDPAARIDLPQEVAAQFHITREDYAYHACNGVSTLQEKPSETHAFRVAVTLPATMTATEKMMLEQALNEEKTAFLARLEDRFVTAENIRIFDSK